MQALEATGDKRLRQGLSSWKESKFYPLPQLQFARGGGVMRDSSVGICRVVIFRFDPQAGDQAVLGLKSQNVATAHWPHKGLRAWHT